MCKSGICTFNIEYFESYKRKHNSNIRIHTKKVMQMGLIHDVNIRITGQVPDDCRDNDYEVLKAEIRLICAKHGLEINEFDF